MKDIETIIEQAGVKPTSNRILVMRELIKSPRPLSLGDLDACLETLEKSSILRALTIFLQHHLIHDIEDGRGVIKYEPCSRHEEGKDMDMHVHFYCEKCQQLTCFEDVGVPPISLPDEYLTHAINYMVKGICPQCRNKR
ncbi:MAG: transcriptional repressor [Bacteroides sp.]|nr:transcriptional repressor [Bacteroides sp.]